MNETKQTDKLVQTIKESCFELLLSDRNGIYIPQIFAKALMDDGEWQRKYNLSPYIELCEELKKGPDDECYWENWEEMLNEFNLDGKWLQQDGDLWLVDHLEMESMLNGAVDDGIIEDIDEVRDMILSH